MPTRAFWLVYASCWDLQYDLQGLAQNLLGRQHPKLATKKQPKCLNSGLMSIVNVRHLSYRFLWFAVPPCCPLQIASTRYTHSLFLKELVLFLSDSRSSLYSFSLSSSQQLLNPFISFNLFKSRGKVLRAKEVWEKHQGGGERPISSEGMGKVQVPVLDNRESTAGKTP